MGFTDPDLAVSSRWAADDIVELAVSEDERVWVPMGEGVWVRPLLFDTVNGAWSNVMRTETTGVVTRHRHAAPVHGFVIDGSWHYLEHDWKASPGSYVYEPAGDTHSLHIDDASRSHTLFWINGTMASVDDKGEVIGYADVFTRIEQARSHYEEVGLGASYAEKLIR